MSVRLNSREKNFCAWYAKKHGIPLADVIEHEKFCKEKQKERSRPKVRWSKP